MADPLVNLGIQDRLLRLAPLAQKFPLPNDNNAPPPPAIPKGMEPPRRYETEFDRKAAEYMKVVPDLPNVPEQYMNLPSVTTNMTAVTTDFPDNKFLDSTSIVLEYKTNEELVELGRVYTPMLISGFSTQGAAAFLLLAYNLQDNEAGGTHVIPEENSIANPMDIDISRLSATVLATGQAHDPFAPTANVEVEAKVYTFIAASTLRMFTKSESNYLAAWGHITKGFQRFYGYPMNVPLSIPKIEALQSLSYFYTNNALFKNTLYKILYSCGVSTAAVGMRKFLFEIHLVNTGLHIVSIFVRLCDVLNCPTSDVIRAIYSPEYERTLSCLIQMINLIVNNDADHIRKMWRYGRLFEESFMAPLQTKKCPTLTYILAAALQSESSATNKDILNIAQLADVSAERQQACVLMGKMLVKVVRKKYTQGAASGVFDMLQA